MTLQKIWFAALMMSVIFLTACGEQPEEKIYVHLETAVELEQAFEEQQEPLQKAEEEEHKLYEEIIQLGMKDFDKIVSLAEKALTSNEKRQNMVQVEMESLEKSFNEFMEVESMIEKVEEEEAQKILNELYETMTNRFEKYQQLNEVYNQSLEEDKRLFTLLMDEELEMTKLQEQINHVNEKYEEIVAAKDAFNQETEAYNQLKKSFYKSVELDVQYE